MARIGQGAWVSIGGSFSGSDALAAIAEGELAVKTLS
jgi:hypothetical protein